MSLRVGFVVMEPAFRVADNIVMFGMLQVTKPVQISLELVLSLRKSTCFQSLLRVCLTEAKLSQLAKRG
jgi:hypothetical protein